MRLNTTNLDRIIIILFLFFAFSACTSEPDPVPTTQIPTLPPNTPTPTPVPATATPEPTTTPIPNPCPTQQILLPPEKMKFEEYPKIVETYLAEGGNPGDIELTDWEGYLSTDLTGDYVDEHIFVFVDVYSAFFPPESTLVIYQCSEGTVNILHSFNPQDWWGIQLIDAQDMTLNGTRDLVFSEVTCGAHTCWHTLHVITWTGSNFTDSVGAEFSYPYPNYAVKQDQLYITSYGIGSAGAGPQRPITTTLAWDGSVVTTTSTTIGPAILRFHGFVDGDTAFQSGQFTIAREFYMRVIEDPGLENWGGFYDVDDENEWLNTLAQWRLINLDANLGNIDAAEKAYIVLNESVPFSSSVYPVVLISQRFWQGIEAGNAISHTCGVVHAMPETLFILDFLNSFGYANPDYESKDLCISPPR